MIHIKESYQGHEICESDGRGGKAGRGKNKTASIQVREGHYWLKKQFRYKVGDPISKQNAVLKAKAWVDSVAPNAKLSDPAN